MRTKLAARRLVDSLSEHRDDSRDVPGIDDKQFQEQAELTKKTCPVSVALSGTEIKLNAELVTS